MEGLEEKLLTAKLRAWGGTVFWFCAPDDRERVALFHRTAQAVGRDGRAACAAIDAEKLAERFDANALLVVPAMRGYLERYLEACPSGARHLLVYSRRNNGPSPINSDFMDLWWGRDVEVWEIGAPWWLLDVETSGLDREKDSVIALRLARLEQMKAVEERTVLVRPEAPLSPWAEKLTGISNRDLEQALPLEDALVQLEAVRGRFLFLDQGFTRPFLENAYGRCGREFPLCFLALDGLLEQAEIPPRQMVKRLLEALPSPPESWPDAAPENRQLARLYQLTRAIFYRLEGTQ